MASYSTLEWAGPPQEAEAVPIERLPHLQHISELDQDLIVDDRHGEPKEDNQTQATLSDEDKDTSAPKPGGEGKKTIFGIRRRTFLIFTGVIILVVAIGAILGGVLGTQLNNDGSDERIQAPSPIGPNASDPSPMGILSTSRLSASNWTSEDGTRHRHVFFQTEDGNLTSRRWDSRHRAWQTTNITQSVLALDSSAGIPAAGTAIASVASDFYPDRKQMRLFFLTQENIIRGYNANDTENNPEDWREYEAMSGWLEPVSAARFRARRHGAVQQQQPPRFRYRAGGPRRGGGGAAAPRFPGGGRVSGQRRQRRQLDRVPHPGEEPRPYPPTSWTARAAQIPFYHLPPGGPATRGPRLWPTYQDLEGRINLAGSNGSNLVWENWGFQWLMEDLPEPDSVLKQHFAVSRMPATWYTMWFARTNSGDVHVSYMKGDPSSSSSSLDISSSGSTIPPNGTDLGAARFVGFEDDDSQAAAAAAAAPWGSIAACHGGFFYGVRNGKILEYLVDEDNPGVLKYNSTVYP